MVKPVKKSADKKAAQMLKDDLWDSLSLQALSPDDKTVLLEELCNTVEQRWLRRVAQRLVQIPELDQTKLLQAGIDEKLDILNQYIPESLEMLLEEAEILKMELSGLVSARAA